MKILILVVLLIPTGAQATAEIIPEGLRGAKIQVTTRDGVVHTEMSEKYMMVSRAKSRALHRENQEYVDRLLSLIEKLRDRTPRKAPTITRNYRHTISGYGGIGPSGLDTHERSDGVVVAQEDDIVGAAMYHYRFYNRLSISGGFATSLQNPDATTYLLGAGLSW